MIGLAGCAGGPRSVDRPSSPNVMTQSEDGEEYELTIIDPGFQRWFATYGRPINYHSPQFYAQQNLQYVSQWNRLADQAGVRGGHDYPFENRIDYRHDVDYGVKLNHELYWYFRYIESLYGQRYSFGMGRRNAMF
jgi:hypothetical protein